MFLRLLFVLLAMLNIMVGAWLLLGQSHAYALAATDPGVPELRLLSELPAQAVTPAPAASVARSALPAPAPAATSAVSPDAPHADVPAELRCLTLGPFATPHDLQQASTALTPVTKNMRTRQEQVALSRSWWVYLPTPDNRAQALALNRQLAAHGIHDYFLVGGGDQPNSTSLGLFKDQDNARKRLAEVAATGLPARVAVRTGTVPQYWLDLVAEGSGFDWRRRIHADGVDSHSTSCF